MPANRPKLTLDEQAFQDLLSAAFTIQEHSNRSKPDSKTEAAAQVRPEVGSDARAGVHPAEVHSEEVRAEAKTDGLCPHCGAAKKPEEARCGKCGQEEFRPGERMQRNWASMWLMSQEQNLWPQGSAGGDDDQPGKTAETEHVDSGIGMHRFGRQAAFDDRGAESAAFAELTGEASEAESMEPVEGFSLSASNVSSPAGELSSDAPISDAVTSEFITTDQMVTDGSHGPHPASLAQRLAGLRVTLRFYRADLYLGAAVFVAVAALMWPAASATQPAALSPMERVLIAVGIAEAPAPAAVHPAGDPTMSVWVDPHTALYYCQGDEQYGKTPDGRVSSQHEAQMDRFQPAGRAPCE